MPEKYEIHLDESGSFEHLSEFSDEYKGKDPVRLVGGLAVPPLLKAREERLLQSQTLFKMGHSLYGNGGFPVQLCFSYPEKKDRPESIAQGTDRDVRA